MRKQNCMRLFYSFCLLALAASAQDYRTEVSVSGGVGLRGAEDLSSGGYGVWTAGAGYKLNDRWTVKGEFAQHRSGVVNLFGGSLMREWERDPARPFAEFGVGAGWSRTRVTLTTPGSQPGSTVLRQFHENHGYLGVTLAAGVTCDFLERYFVRPQVRMHLMGPIYLGVQPAVALGVRF